MSVKLMKGDCLELMKQIEDESIDLVLADPPFGVTANQWDSVIPLKPLFEQYQRIIKPHGAVLLFGMGKFGAQLIMNAPKKMPLRAHENVYVFYKHLPTYQPQMRLGFKPYKKRDNHDYVSSNYGLIRVGIKRQSPGKRFPIDVIKFSNGNHSNMVHPTQKPVDLLQYLIKTYTNEGMTVLDNTMGSGSTGVAAVSLNRNFIGMELDKDYFEIAKQRILKE